MPHVTWSGCEMPGAVAHSASMRWFGQTAKQEGATSGEQLCWFPGPAGGSNPCKVVVTL